MFSKLDVKNQWSILKLFYPQWPSLFFPPLFSVCLTENKVSVFPELGGRRTQVVASVPMSCRRDVLSSSHSVTQETSTHGAFPMPFGEWKEGPDKCVLCSSWKPKGRCLHSSWIFEPQTQEGRRLESFILLTKQP